MAAPKWEDYVEPGILATCRMINDSGLGSTFNSCEGHVWDERKARAEFGPYDPIVGFDILDLERLSAWVPALLSIKGKEYFCGLNFYDSRLLGTRQSSPCVEISLEVDAFRPFHKSGAKAQMKRAVALKTAREHLERVLSELVKG